MIESSQSKTGSRYDHIQNNPFDRDDGIVEKANKTPPQPQDQEDEGILDFVCGQVHDVMGCESICAAINSNSIDIQTIRERLGEIDLIKKQMIQRQMSKTSIERDGEKVCDDDDEVSRYYSQLLAELGLLDSESSFTVAASQHNSDKELPINMYQQQRYQELLKLIDADDNASTKVLTDLILTEEETDNVYSDHQNLFSLEGRNDMRDDHCSTLALKNEIERRLSGWRDHGAQGMATMQNERGRNPVIVIVDAEEEAQKILRKAPSLAMVDDDKDILVGDSIREDFRKEAEERLSTPTCSWTDEDKLVVDMYHIDGGQNVDQFSEYSIGADSIEDAEGSHQSFDSSIGYTVSSADQYISFQQLRNGSKDVVLCENKESYASDAEFLFDKVPTLLDDDKMNVAEQSQILHQNKVLSSKEEEEGSELSTYRAASSLYVESRSSPMDVAITTVGFPYGS